MLTLKDSFVCGMSLSDVINRQMTGQDATNEQRQPDTVVLSVLAAFAVGIIRIFLRLKVVRRRVPQDSDSTAAPPLKW